MPWLALPLQLLKLIGFLCRWCTNFCAAKLIGGCHRGHGVILLWKALAEELTSITTAVEGWSRWVCQSLAAVALACHACFLLSVPSPF